LKRFIVYKGLKDLMLIYPVYTLFFEAAGLPLYQVSLLLALWSLPAVVLEVPSGVLADRWSRKSMILLSCLLKAVCFLLWAVNPAFPFFAFGFLCWGISEAFSSGAEEALLFESLKSKGEEGRFERIYGRAMAADSIAVAISSFSGGYLAHLLGYRLVVLLSMLGSLLTFAVALGFQDVNLQRQTQPSFAIVKQAFTHLVKKRDVLVLAALLVVPISLADMLDEYDALIAASYQVPLAFVGVWVGGRYLLQALGAVLAEHVSSRMLNAGRIVCLVGGFLLLASRLIPSIGGLVCYFLFYLLLATSSVIQENRIQLSIEEQGRATVQSLISLATNLHALLVFTALALFASVSTVVGVVALYCLISCIGIGWLLPQKRKLR
jgi:MFS family permease